MSVKSSPVTWILGRQYVANSQVGIGLHAGSKGQTVEQKKQLQLLKQQKQIADEVLRHAQSFFRFTYRKNLPGLSPYDYITSDQGWGCMLRSAQMIMGYAMRRHFFGKDWRLPSNPGSLRQYDQYCEILKWFVDYPGYPHIYALHHLVQCGMKYDKLPGEWYGPSTACLVLRDLARTHRRFFGGPVEVLVTQGDTLYISEAEKICGDSNINQQVAQNYDLFLDYIKNNTGTTNPSTTADDRPSDANKSPLSMDPTNASNSDSVTAAAASADATESGKDESNAWSKQHSQVGTNIGDRGTVGKITGEESEYRGFSGMEKENELFFDPLLRPPPSHLLPWRQALIVFIPLRLGISTVNREYYEELKLVLQHQQCIGILGGRVGHAIYFVGYRDATGSTTAAALPSLSIADERTGGEDSSYSATPATPPCTSSESVELLGLDPHTVYSNPAFESTAAESVRARESASNQYQQSSSIDESIPAGSDPLSFNERKSDLLSSSAMREDDITAKERSAKGDNGMSQNNLIGAFPTDEHISQIHVAGFTSLALAQLDPSLALGFYFANREEFEKFSDEMRLRGEEKLRLGRSPLFTVQHTPPSYASFDLSGSDDSVEGSSRHGGDGRCIAGDSSGMAGMEMPDADEEEDDDEYVFL